MEIRPGGLSVTSRSRGANVLVALAGNAVAPLASLAAAPVLAQVLGVQGRGDVAAATAPLLLAAGVATFGIPASITFSVARHPAVLRAATLRGSVVLLVAGAGVSLLIAGSSGALAGGDDSVGRMIALAATALVPTLLVAVLRAAASGLHRWRAVSVERVLTAVFRLAALLVLAATGSLEVWSAVAVIALAPVVGGLAYLPGRTWAPVPAAARPDSAAPSPRLGSYAMRVWLGSVSGILLLRLDQVLLTPLSSAAELGLYVVAVNVADLPLVVSNAIRDVSFSAEAAEHDDERLLSLSRVSTAVSVLLAGALAATARAWMPLVFGDDFDAALPACLWLLVGVAVGAQGALAGTALSARGAPGRRSASLAVAVVVNAVLIVLLAPALGAVGAAVATVVGSGTASVVNLVQVWRLHGIAPVRFLGLRARDLRAVRSGLARFRGDRVARA